MIESLVIEENKITFNILLTDNSKENTYSKKLKSGNIRSLASSGDNMIYIYP